MITDEYHYTLYRKSGKDRKNSIYYYSFKNSDGKWVARSTGQTTERKARVFVNKQIAEGLFKETRVSKDLTFREFAEQNHFWEYDKCPIVRDALARKGKYSRDNCKANGDCMRKHIVPFFGDVMMTHITKGMINSWLINLPDAAKLSSKSVNSLRCILYQMLQVAADMGLVRKELVLDKAKPLRKNAKDRPAFSPEQVNAIFETEWKNKHAYIGCRLASVTGMRLGEIKALKPEQVFPDHIHVDAAWADGEGRKSTKSGKTRDIPITTEIYNMIQQIIFHKGLIFSSDGVKPMGDKFFNAPLNRRMDELGIDHSETETETALSFHSFRHFFNSRLVAAGISGEIIRAIMGHESTEMTQHYTHLQLSDNQAVTELQATLFSGTRPKNKELR